jgi:superfamily I DNA/RNA helicase
VKLKILGPPGCGKTTTLMDLLEKEISTGMPPERIAFLTFTRAARKEALERTGKTEKDFPFLKTIHSICYHQLSVGKDQIVRPNDLSIFGNKMGIKLTGNNLDPWIEEFERGIDAPTRDDILIQANHFGRHRKIMLKEALQEISFEIDYKYAVWLTNAYREWKKVNGILDYTDLLSQYISYGKSLSIDAIFVDEAQDLSSLQWDAVSKLGEQAKRWYIAGDDDQAIFHWAGADATAFQDFPVDETMILNQSYRVSKAVHGAAMRIASRIGKRLPKDYSPTESEGEVRNTGLLSHIDFSQKTFILFRNHYRGHAISEILKNDLLPFIGRGSILNDIDTRASLYTWYLLIRKGEVSSDLLRKFLRFADEDFLNPKVHTLIKEKPVLTVDQILLEKPEPNQLTKILKDLPNLTSITPYIRRHGLFKVSQPKVELLSIHQSKGREAHTVVIDPEMSKAVWLGMMNNPDDEHRVWYVGTTRAKEKVLILMPDGNYAYRF